MTSDALPALGLFDFPTALVVTEAGRIITEAGEVDAVLPFASVTKPIVAWAALIAVERGMLGLDDPAGEGLDGATIRHLLAHASGVAPDSGEPLAEPGARRIYSNRGIEILGRRLTEATATDLEAWVETTVLEPLGMASVLIPGSPAHSGQGSARDLSVFARELAAPRLLGAGLAEQACTPVYPGLAGVLPGYGKQNPNLFGLGVEIRGDKQPHWTGTGNSPATFGHFGQSGSFLWVDPVAGRQAVFLGERPFGQAHRRAWTALNDQILALPPIP
ncbi:beta-lactamase [Actinomyces sp. Chiba101]|uniref:serine hydrolase domain-containing protein n=1 Tax=Actinomyces TaxID=1654 RepID=UPI000974F25D|nr:MULTISPECIES: serine hydrolase domain-containing protein [Actinomyces]BAW92207.1 beta-lactamase [Actinomyces sp. Chiba101]GAV94854.1 beta-lactamase [Actinomyces denticolens]SUU10614.1 putative periplasmic esterase [Actinomyces denticolens]